MEWFSQRERSGESTMMRKIYKSCRVDAVVIRRSFPVKWKDTVLKYERVCERLRALEHVRMPKDMSNWRLFCHDCPLSELQGLDITFINR